MTIASVGTLGSAANTGNNQASTTLTTSAACEAGNLLVVIIATDNDQTTDGASTAVSGITAGGVAMIKAIEYTNSLGSTQDGASVGVWYQVRATQLNSSSSIVASFTSGTLVDASALSAWEFTLGSGSSVRVEATATLSNDAAAAGSLNATTANIECLRIRAIASESSSTTALTKTAAFTAVLTQSISGAGTSTAEVGIRGEYLISTSTGQASAPTGGAGAVDHASVYVAFAEVFPGVGAAAGTVTTADAVGSSITIASGDGAAAGAVTTADAVGTSISAQVATSNTNIGDALAVGAPLFSAVAASAGTVTTADAVGISYADGVAASTGTGASVVVGTGIVEAVGGAATGTGTATGVGASYFDGVGSSSGTSTPLGVSTPPIRGYVTWAWLEGTAAVANNVASASGTGTATGVGASIAAAAGSAAGTSTGLGANIQATLAISATDGTNASTYLTGSFTPADGDLLVVFVTSHGSNNRGTVTSTAGTTFTSLHTGPFFNVSPDEVRCFVADQLSTAVSQTLTFDCTGDAATASIIQVIRVSGLKYAGGGAVRQFARVANGTGGTTPTLVFDMAVRKGNLVLATVGNGSTPSGLVQPSGWAELNDDSHSSPNGGAHVVSNYANDAATQVGTTVTWGGTSATDYAIYGIEINTTGPLLISKTDTVINVDQTQHLISMPALTLPGELLITLFASDGNPTITTPSGWTQLYDAGQTGARGAAYSRIADGTEGGTTVDFVTSASEAASAQVLRITGGTGQLAGVEVGTAQTATGSGTDFTDPPGVTASWGAFENLFITVFHTSSGFSPDSVDGPPSGWHYQMETNADAGTAAGQVFSVIRKRISATEDPGNWDWASSGVLSTTNTIVVRWNVQEAVGASTGTGTATGVGVALTDGVGASSGTGTATGVGASIFSGVGSSTGTGTATGVGSSTADSVAHTPYVAHAVHFDGSAVLTQSSLTVADSGYILVSGWFKIPADYAPMGSFKDGASQRTFFGTFWDNDNDVFASFRPDSGSAAFTLTPDSAWGYGTWFHVLIYGDVDQSSGNKVMQIAVNGVLTTPPYQDDTTSVLLDILGTTFYFPQESGGGFPFDVADYQLWTDVPADLSADGFFDNFIVDGLPVPTSVANTTLGPPTFSFKGDASEFITNQGTGGSFSLTGTVPNATTNPSGAALISQATAVGASTADSVASSTGTSTVTGVGASYADGVASSTGTSTVLGVDGSTASNNVGSSSGTGTATGVGTAVLDGVASSSGTGTATGIGASTADSVASSTGTSTVTGVGAPLFSGVGSSTGTSTATGVGASTADSVASSTGTSTVTGVGAPLFSGVGSSTGAGTATGVGASTAASVASSTGTGTATGVGTGINAAVASSTGLATVTGVGASTAESVASSTGTSTVSGVGASTFSGVGSSTGTGTATGIGASTADSVASSSGTGTATAISESSGDAVGSSTGTSTVTGVGLSLFDGVASSSGTSTVTGVATSTADSVASSTGTGTATGVGASTADSVASSTGTSTADGLSGAVGDAIATAAGTSIVSGIGVSYADAVGSSTCSSSADADGNNPAYLRPTTTDATGTWRDQLGGTDLDNAIDETTRDDADYIRSSLDPVADTCRINLGMSGGVYVDGTKPVRLGYTVAAGTGVSVEVRLMQGATLITTWNHSGLSASPSLFVQTLTSIERADIDWNHPDDLKIEFEASL